MRLISLIYLLALAAVLGGCDKVTLFEEMSEEQTGIQFVNDITETEHNNLLTFNYSYIGAGVATGDLNGDGFSDVYFAGNSQPNKLYLNRGDWKFVDVSEASGTQGRPDWATGVSFADVNGDGWLDIYVCYSGNAPGEGEGKPLMIDRPERANQLFINQGTDENGVPIFEDKAKEYGLDAIGTFSTQSYFLDYDQDGDLDMFLLNHANMFTNVFFNVTKLRGTRHPYFGNKLFRNDNNSFTEVSEDAGIHGGVINFGLSAAITDLNNDGWPDIYVTNDYEEQDFFYVNNQDGTFSDVSKTIFGHLSKYSMGSDIADINNDGLADVFVTDMLPEDNERQKLLTGLDNYEMYRWSVDSGYHHQFMRNTLQLNQGFSSDGLPRFSEVGQMTGISNTDWSWATLLADFDNDGFKDAFVANGFLRDVTNLDFTKYIVSNAAKKAKEIDVLGLIQSIPSTKVSNYVFSNTGGVGFTNSTQAWGLYKPSISNSAVYADLDNDGDLDLIICNLEEPVMVYQNHQESVKKNNYIKIELKGVSPNTYGLGAKVWVTLDNNEQLRYEAYYARGYMSSVEPVLTIGVGRSSIIKEVKVEWPNGQQSVVTQVEPNQRLVLNQEEAGDPVERTARTEKNSMIVKETAENGGIDFIHKENEYVDFKGERLLLYQISRLGGKMAVADVNGDGNDDVYFGGAAGQSSQLYFGHDDGTFTSGNAAPWEADKDYEDVDALFFDSDLDGDLDLYVVSGGNELPSGSAYYQDRIYVNDGNGIFTRVNVDLPVSSGGVVSATDFDKDGDLDLFVGARLSPQSYPYTPESSLLINETDGSGSIVFREAMNEYFGGVSSIGMVTDAVWSDINNDSWVDLVVVGEYMPVSVFENREGKSFTNVTASMGLEKSNGWWSKISLMDIDGDGDQDFLLGNAGENLRLHASLEEPITCYAQDINNDGHIDPIVCHFIQGKSYPLPSRDDLLDQVIPLRKKFIFYENYANATIEDIVDPETLSTSRILRAYTLKSSFLENRGDGKFELKPLPHLAQVSMINGFVQGDFNQDGSEEVLAVGNFYPYRVMLGRSDASQGVYMNFKNGVPSIISSGIPVGISGDIRDVSIVRFNNAGFKIIVSRNDDRANVYELNQDPLGAVVNLF